MNKSAEVDVKGNLAFAIFDGIVNVWHKEKDPNFAMILKESVLESLLKPQYKWIFETISGQQEEVKKLVKVLRELLECDYTSGTHLYCAQTKAKEAIKPYI